MENGEFLTRSPAPELVPRKFPDVLNALIGYFFFEPRWTDRLWRASEEKWGTRGGGGGGGTTHPGTGQGLWYHGVENMFLHRSVSRRNSSWDWVYGVPLGSHWLLLILLKIVLVDLLKNFSIFRKWTIPSESTIKPTGNCFEWHVVI